MPKSSSDQMESLQGNGDNDTSPPPTAESTESNFQAFIICPRKFQNVRKNQLPFGQKVRNWFWSIWITELNKSIVLSDHVSKKVTEWQTE